MSGILYRLLVVVWFLAYTASLYLLLHMLVAGLSRRPQSRLLWFFAIVTSPLTRPVRAALRAGTPEPRVRAITLLVLVTIWMAARWLLGRLGGVPRG